MTSKKKSIKKKSSFFSLFLIFIFIALLTVFLLEYLDFKKGKKSFIFKKVIPLENISRKSQYFTKKFIQFLNRNEIQFDYFKDEKSKYHFKLDINQPDLKALVNKLKRFVGLINFRIELSEIQNFPEKIIHLYLVKLKRKTTHAILITGAKVVSQKKEPKVVTGDILPKIAFIIDDMGNRKGVTLNLKKLNIPITASILPDTPYAVKEAKEIQNFGLEAMIHLPMQPKNLNHYPFNRLKVIGTDSKVEEIDQIIKRAIQLIPNAIGINNHEGSLTTSNQGIMKKILKLVKKEGLFFVDSRTIYDSVAYDIAKQLNIKTAYRDVFLDSYTSYSNSINQIRRLIKIAKQKGKAIAIGHPFDSTIKAIRDSIKTIQNNRIEIVFVSQIVD